MFISDEKYLKRLKEEYYKKLEEKRKKEEYYLLSGIPAMKQAELGSIKEGGTNGYRKNE